MRVEREQAVFWAVSGCLLTLSCLLDFTAHGVHGVHIQATAYKERLFGHFLDAVAWHFEKRKRGKRRRRGREREEKGKREGKGREEGREGKSAASCCCAWCTRASWVLAYYCDLGQERDMEHMYHLIEQESIRTTRYSKFFHMAFCPFPYPDS